jgi:hypothetical protein
MTIEHASGSPPKLRGFSLPDGAQPFVMIGFGWLAQIIYSLSSSPGSFATSVRVFMVLWFIGASAFFFGTIAAMIFRTRSVDSRTEAAKAKPAPKTRAEESLEEIYDWLTKIIIGLVLVNARQFVTYLGEIGHAIGLAIAPAAQVSDILLASGQIMGVGSIIYGFACGFLRGSFWPRDFSRG